MKHLTNLCDPSLEDAKTRIIPRPDETEDEAWNRMQKWLKGKVIGKPKATESYTVEQLEKQNIVGIYSKS